MNSKRQTILKKLSLYEICACQNKNIIHDTYLVLL